MINNKPSSQQTSWQYRFSCRLFLLLYTTAIVEAVVQYTLQRFPEEASLWECLPRIEQLFWNRWLSLLPFWSFACPPKQSQKTLRVTFVPRFPIVSGVGNLSVVSVINSSHSKTPHIMDLVRRLRYLSMQHNFIVRAHHVPGVSNAIADALSRFQMQHFRVLSPDADQNPCTILPSLKTLWERKSCGTLPLSYRYLSLLPSCWEHKSGLQLCGKTVFTILPYESYLQPRRGGVTCFWRDPYLLCFLPSKNSTA